MSLCDLCLHPQRPCYFLSIFNNVDCLLCLGCTMIDSLFVFRMVCPILACLRVMERIALIEILHGLCKVRICVHFGTFWESAMGCFISRAANAPHGRPTHFIAKPRTTALVVRPTAGLSLTMAVCLAAGHCSIYACRSSARSRHP